MNNYYPSKYNFFWKINSEYCVLYNTKTGSLGVFEIGKFKEIEKALDGKDISDVAIKEFLISEKFLIDNKIDELEHLKKDFFDAKFNLNNLNLILHPTSKCNFNCKYCFESKKIRQTDSKMSEETQNSIVSILEEKKDNIKQLDVLWFGGEPLLAIDIIKRLSERFIRICEENDIRYQARIVTNGYLLNRENVDCLVRYKVTNMQVTIDGLKKTHNERRPLKSSNKDTYEVIMKNLFYAAKEFKRIVVRINIDKKNKDDIEPLLKRIKKINGKNNVIISLARVLANTESNSDYMSNCLSCGSFIDYELQFVDKLKKYGFQYSYYPSRISHICAADQINSYVIASDGKIYKCFNDIEDEKRSIGGFKDFSKIHDSSISKKYMDFDPTDDDTCKNCKLLPLCMGGCLRSRLFDNKKECSAFKGNLKEIIFHYVENQIYNMK